MALLAILDVDDAATEKIKRTKSALEDLVQTAQRSAAAIARNTSATSAAQAASGGFGQINQNVAQLVKLAQDANAALATLAKSVDALGEAMKRIPPPDPLEKTGSALDKVKAQAAAVAAALDVLGANMKASLEHAAELAARIETLGVVTQVTARNAGYTTAQLQAQTAGIKALGITTQEATDSVLQFVRSNLNLADATKLARVAQNLAVVAGENSSQTFNRLTQSIQMQETMLLRQVGIVTTNEALWREYAQTIGKTATQLTQAEKQQAFVNKILNEGAKVAGTYEASMETAGKQLKSMERLTEELSLKIGQALLPAFSAIVKAVFSMLEWMNKLDPVWIRIAASMAAAVTVMTLVAGGIVTLTVSIAALSTVLEALEISLGPVGWLALGLGVVAGALVAFSSGTEATTMQLAEQAAQVNENTKVIKASVAEIDKLNAAGVEMAKVGDKQTDAQKQLRESTDALAKAVPSAREEFDKLTGSYILNRNEIYRVLGANEELRKMLAKGAELQVKTMELNKLAAEQEERQSLEQGNAARKHLDELAEQIKKLEARQKRGIDPGPELGYLKIAYDKLAISVMNYGAQNMEAQKKVAVLTVQIKNANELIDEMNMNLGDRQKKILEGVTHGWDAFVDRAKKVGVSLKEITNFKLDDANEGKFRQQVAGIMSTVEKAEQKAAANEAKSKQAFESALLNIRGDAIATQAQLKAVDQGLGEVKEGTEEYRTRVQRASAAIAQFNKASADTKVGLTNLAKAAEYLKGIQLEKWVEGVSEQFNKLATSGAEAMNKVSQGFSGEINRMFIEQLDKNFEAQQANADKIYDLDKEIADKRAEAALDSTDLAIYQEDRRVEGIERAIEKEIAARERAQAKTEQLFEDRVRQAQAEVRDLERNIKLQMDLREEQMAMEIKFQYLTMGINEDEANQKLDLLHKEADAARARNADARQERLQEISEEADVGRRRLQQTRELNAQMAADQRAALGRTRQASAETVQQIRRDAGLIFQLTKGIAESLAQSISKGFLDILTQARSTKDAFVGIIRSMADTVLNIISDMVSQWIKKAALMATSNGGFNVGTFVRALAGTAGSAGAASAGQGVGAGFGGMPIGMAGGVGGHAGSTAAQQVGSGVIIAGSAYAVGSLMASKFGRDSYFHSGGVGAAAGAATGAAIGSVVPVLGTGIGAGVGAIAGAIGGWMQERKRRKELMAERDSIIGDMGGLDEFKRKAEEAGVALDKFLSTKKSKEYATELDKIQKAFVALDIKKFIEAQGGMDAIKEKAKAAGIELTQAFLKGTGEAKDMQAELEKVAKALALKEAKEGLAKTAVQMDELRKRAVLVGYDLKKLYDTKTIEEFNNEQAKLNKLLEEQQTRLQGLGTAATGINQMLTGLSQHLERGFADVFSTLGKKGQEEFQKAFEDAQKQGYAGGPLKFMLEHMDDFKQSMTEATGLFDYMQRSVDRVGGAISATFGGVLRETGDIMQAFNAVSGSLDELAKIAQETGVEFKGSLKYLMQFRTTIKDNEDVANSLSGINQILKGLSDGGRLTAQVFNDMGADAADQWAIMKERGVAADQALMLMQPTLQALYEAQKNYGFATDEATQKLIDMGVANGVVGDQFQSVNQKMLDMLMLIAEALGATIPEAYRNQTQAAQDAAAATQDAADATTDLSGTLADHADDAGDATDDWRKHIETVQDTTETYDQYLQRTQWNQPFDRASDGVTDMNANIRIAQDTVHTFADAAVIDLERVAAAASAISLGHSPGGLKEIPYKTRDALAAFSAMRIAADRDLGAVERTANAMTDAMDTRVHEAPRDGSRSRDEAGADGSPKVHVEYNPEVKIEISTVNADGMDKVWREDFHPRLMAALETNAHQTASRVEAAARRYRK